MRTRDVPRTVQPTSADRSAPSRVRVRDADAAFQRANELGAWEIPARAARWSSTSRHPRRRRKPHLLRRPLRRVLDLRRRLRRDSDGRPPSARHRRPALLRHRPVIVRDRTADWVEFYSQLFGFRRCLTAALRHHAEGPAARSPCHKFFLQLIEPDDIRPVRPGRAPAADRVRHAGRAGDGRRLLEKRGVEFRRSRAGAAERARRADQALGGVMFELVHNEPPAAARNDLRATSAWTRRRSRARSKPSSRRCGRGLLAGDDFGGRRRRPSRRRGRRPARCARAVCASPAPSAARLRGPFRPAARLQGRHRANRCCDVCGELGGRAARWSKRRRRRTRTPIPTPSRAICASSRSWPYRSASASRSRACRGAGRARLPPAGDLVFRTACPNLGLAIDAFDVLAAGATLEELDASIPDRSSSCSSPTTCGRRCARRKSRRRPRRTSASSPAKARTATTRRASSRARRDRLRRRLQLRRLQRRLPADSPGGRRRESAKGRRLARRDRAAARAADPPTWSACNPGRYANDDAIQTPRGQRPRSVSAVPRHDDVRRSHRCDARRGEIVDACDARRQLHRHRRRLREGRVGRDRRRGDRRQPAALDPRDQGRQP